MKNKNFFPRLFLILLLILFGLIFLKNKNLFSQIFSISILNFIILSLFVLLNFFFNTLVIIKLLKIGGIKISYLESFSLVMASRLSNYLFSHGGFITKTAYLKSEHGISITKNIYLFGFLAILQTMNSITIIIFGLLYNKIFFNIVSTNLSLFLAFGLIFFLIIIIFFIYTPTQLKKLKIWKKILLAKKLAINNKNIVLQIWLINIFSIILLSFRTLYIYYINDIFITFPTALMISTAGLLSFIFSFTPAALGTRELAMSYIAKINGEEFTAALTISSLDRTIMLFWILLLGIFFSLKLYKKNAKQ